MDMVYVTGFRKNNPNHTLEVSRSMVLKNSSQHNLSRIASTHVKFTQKIYQSITFQTTSSTCSCLQGFPPNKIENLNSWTSEVVS